MEKESVEEKVVDGIGGQYLSFVLSNRIFAIPILTVKEIISLLPITELPRIPSDYRGVINLRGKIIPVVDLRIRFGMEIVEDTEDTGIVVITLQQVDKELTIGVIIDNVLEVLDIKEKNIEPVPEFGANVDLQFIIGIYQKDERVMSLLDIEKALTEEEIRNIEKLEEPDKKTIGE